MSKLERLLVPGAIKTPDCACDAEMLLDHTEPAEQSVGTEIRVYICPTCQHELRLMVWAESTMPIGPIAGM
jgi:hypothetical protein